MDISFREAGFTGIFLIRDSGSEIAGSAFNEFGIKGFDFIFNKQKGKVKFSRHMIRFLNKWYVKKILRADLAFLLRKNNTAKQQRNRKTHTDNGHVILENTKYNITYKFKLLHETEG